MGASSTRARPEGNHGGSPRETPQTPDPYPYLSDPPTKTTSNILGHSFPVMRNVFFSGS